MTIGKAIFLESMLNPKVTMKVTMEITKETGAKIGGIAPLLSFCYLQRFLDSACAQP
jgi:hypothetical protein